ncbi:MAG: hypothetical protein ACREVI_13590 [Steroidobacteraceae bacterium]
MAVLGKAEGEFVASLTAQLWWVIREDDRKYRARNGSAFFLDAGEGLFAVTANHVLEEWRSDRRTKEVVALQLGDIPFEPDGRHRVIATHGEIDIATFRITAAEVRVIGKSVLTGSQSQWPPRPPQQHRGVYYAGLPGIEKQWLSQDEISFGIVPGGGVTSSVSDLDVSSLIEREHIIPVLGGGLPPENFDFRGISGGPMLSVIEYRGLLRSWALAGVIYEGPSTSPDPDLSIAGLEIIRARRAYFIRADGTLDAERWDTIVSPSSGKR